MCRIRVEQLSVVSRQLSVNPTFIIHHSTFLIPPPPLFVGRITGMVDCDFSDPSTLTFSGAYVPLGRKYALSSGLMEITYDTGAKVILQGPCTYEVTSSAAGHLSIGKLTARVEKSRSTRYGVRKEWRVASG